MSTTFAEPLAEPQTPASPPPEQEQALEYRAVHSGAIISALLGLLSIFMLFTTEFLEVAIMVAIIPLAGLVISLAALRKISKNHTIYTGRPFAMFGLVMSATLLLFGVGMASYTHVTEVPEGYERISFATLKPSPKDEEAGRPIPKDVQNIAEEGKPIFIKGYIRPGTTDSRTGATSFLLVRDNNECCFGDQSKVAFFDQIYVQLDEKFSIRTDLSVTRVGGRLEYNALNLRANPPQPVYFLRADHVK